MGRSYSVQHNSIRMDSKIVYQAVLLLLCLIHAGSSLSCFQCNSFNNDTCGDPFFGDGNNLKTAKEQSFLKECPTDTEYFCRKIYQNVRGEVRVIRNCGSERDEKDRDCYTTVLEEYNTKVCQCEDEDGCNSGNSVSYPACLPSTIDTSFLIAPCNQFLDVIFFHVQLFWPIHLFLHSG